MRIKQLKLSGFKSFVEPAELRIETGLTGIVGPNGCGKSNLLEAIRWVMGEASAKSLRGGGMEDVIFAGTASRPPRDFAEVTIRADRDMENAMPGFASNDDDPELEVTRRIERGAGSAYRANGRDVRAKDVALIFADAATGAHSPALVSQGRIGAIISAKPQERRQMLEEAAGISGLHVRRKDAEQKLRAAENNLSRLATILEDMGNRASQLRRQAKQAERYKKLSQLITQAEARLIFIRWKEAKAAADSAKAEAEQASGKVEEAAKQHAALNSRHENAVSKLANDRALAMATRDAANDMSNNLVKLTGERDHVTTRQNDLQSQAERLDNDSAREGKLTHDAATALENLKAENIRLAAEIQTLESGYPALQRAAENSERQARESEVALAKAMAQQARAEAEQRVADAAMAAANKQVERTQSLLQSLEQEQANLGNEAEQAQLLSQAQITVSKLEERAQHIAADLERAEIERQKIAAQRDIAQSAAAGAQAELAALISEQNALQRALKKGEGDKAIDRVKVSPGYERAFAAALGDDANAVIGGNNGRRWGKTANHTATKNVPENRLSQYVNAPDELALRLSMTHIVENDDGQILQPGERLVTMDGKLRRWDGFIAEDDGAATAEQLIRINRLNELLAQIPDAEKALAQQESHVQNLHQQLRQKLDQQNKFHSDAKDNEAKLRQAYRENDKAKDDLARLQNAVQALAERQKEADQQSNMAAAEMQKAQQALAVLPDSGAHGILVEKLEKQGTAIRQALIQSQADISSLDQRTGQAKERRAVAQAEIRGWQERAGEAEKRMSEMKKRAEEIALELKILEDKPDILAGEITRAEQARSAISAKLQALQSAESESEAALKQLETEMAKAAETLSSARELRAGAQARAENQELRRVEMGRVSGERFECPPPVLPEKMDFDEDDLNDAPAESARLDKLQADRERIGPVNLIAADELTELETEQAKGLAESAELTEAINRLRGSIGSLNREGRQRLLTAFEAVDGHFRRLFTTLFNGGGAHLELIDSDDPLEAGLEIMAQPPGKKLASLTLLSGGEQALTAVALIFGLFLTNPAPICVLDEVDAPLDDANIERFCDLLDVMQKETDTRYLIVTHNAVTMSRMHRLFGVTMVEQGVSRLVSVDLSSAEELLAAE